MVTPKWAESRSAELLQVVPQATAFITTAYVAVTMCVAGAESSGTALPAPDFDHP